MGNSETRFLQRLGPGSMAVASLALIAAACGSATHSTSSASNPPASAQANSSAYTVSAQQVARGGTVLVNGSGRTLYLLSSEKGGKITCTDANGCTKYWPPVELPEGVSAPVAGRGINGSLLGTVRSASGDLYVTYGGWPLYTFSGDTADGQTSGIGVNSFGGTWYAVSTTGSPAGSASAPTTTPTTAAGSGSSGGGGYGGGGY